VSLLLAAFTAVGGVVVVTAGLAAVASLPGLLRYLRIRKM